MHYLSVFISVLAQAISLAILARVLISWVPSLQTSRFGVIVYDITEPILGPIRKVIPPLGMIDLSPFIALIAVELLARLLQRLIR